MVIGFEKSYISNHTVSRFLKTDDVFLKYNLWAYYRSICFILFTDYKDMT